MIVYFTPNAINLQNPNIDPAEYSYNSDELQIPPMTCVICIPCRNIDHFHNIQDCVLLTYDRGWDHVRPHDFVTVYVLDNDTETETLSLESGELLSSFLLSNQELFGVPVDKCVLCVDPYLAENIDSDDDDGYYSNVSEE